MILTILEYDIDSWIIAATRTFDAAVVPWQPTGDGRAQLIVTDPALGAAVKRAPTKYLVENGIIKEKVIE